MHLLWKPSIDPSQHLPVYGQLDCGFAKSQLLGHANVMHVHCYLQLYLLQMCWTNQASYLLVPSTSQIQVKFLEISTTYPSMNHKSEMKGQGKKKNNLNSKSTYNIYMNHILPMVIRI